MAKHTPKSYRNQVMYCVYVRNHTPEGTFEGVRRDLERIRALGVDIVWLMPIHPVGIKAHKGTLGCPYAIRDYRAVNPEYGTLEDFRALVEECHRLGMKCIIDVVYNHTSPDSWLAQNHPEWFYRKPDGSPGGRFEDWTDVVDLDYSHEALWDYQIETLKYWGKMVDGFRCDVASAVPLEFWEMARREVETVRPGCFWLAESVHPEFIAFARSLGYACASDAELYQVFDITYEYDIFHVYHSYLEGKISLEAYAGELQRQEIVYPDNFVKLTFLENHDNPRTAFLIPDEKARRNFTALLYFRRGLTLIYGGQERSCTDTPSLFDRDPVNWQGSDISRELRQLYQMKKHPLLTDGALRIRTCPGDVLLCTYTGKSGVLAGVFSLKGAASSVQTDLPDGCYLDLLSGLPVEVKMGSLSSRGEPLIFSVGMADQDAPGGGI